VWVLNVDAARIKPTTRRLFEFLRQREQDQKSFTIAVAAEATGLSEESVRTYVSKKLRDRYVWREDSKHYAVRGMSGVTLDEFVGVMTQKLRPPAASLDAWRDELARFAEQGAKAGFPVSDVFESLAKAHRAK
jgi:hypothetical protein